jgi:DNA repair exonuclease SbcCD ATPase subunit
MIQKIQLKGAWRRVLVGAVVAGLAGIAGSEHHARRLIQSQFHQAVEARQQLERRFGEVMAAHERLKGDFETERRRSQELEQTLASANSELEQTTGRLAEESRTSRTLQLRLAEMQQQLDQLQGELAVTLKQQEGVLGVKPGTVQIERVVVSDAAGSNPSGRVISIHRDWDFVVISLGWDTVRIGDVVSIFRQDQLQAKARIERVQEGVCAATVLPDWKTDAIQLNDLARVL